MNSTKIIWFVLFEFLLAVRLSAQTKIQEFGTVPVEQLSMKSYALDNQAEAVVISDIGSTTFIDLNNEFQIIFTRTTRIKILAKAGMSFASMEIPYYMEYNELEKVFDIEGYTYNLDQGEVKRTKLQNDAVYEERISENLFVKKFAMPDVKEGSVIEFKYKVMSPFFFNLHDWEFQSEIPTIYSEYTVKMIPFYEYSYILQGAKKFDVFKNEHSFSTRNFNGIEYPDNVFTFGMNNVPAFRDEEYITSRNDYLVKLDFQLSVIHHSNGANIDVITTWPLLIKELLKHNDFGLYMKSVERNAEEILAGLSLESKSPGEKARILTSYVKGNFSWNGSKSKFSSQSVKDLIKNKTGNSADINLFLCALLKSSGIQCYPLLLSTRDHGKVFINYPFQQFLNYVIVNAIIDNTPVLIDATESLSPFGLLPARCINEKGLVVNKDTVDWISLKDDAPSEENDSICIAVNNTGDSALMKVNMQTTGHRALDYRSFYLTNKNDFSKRFMNKDMAYADSISGINTTNIEKPFIVTYEAVIPVETIGDKLLVSPFAGLTFEENPLKVGFRNYPVDMIYPLTKTFYCIIEIPKGYKFAEQTKNKAVDNALVRFSYSTEIMSDKVFYVQPYRTAEECMAIMINKRIRHLPVLDNENLIGVISIGDVVKAVIDEKEFVIEQLEEYISGRKITSIV
jgi:CBS domain-containing protein